MDLSAMSDRQILEKVICESVNSAELSYLINNVEKTIGFSLSNTIDTDYDRLMCAYNSNSKLALHIQYLQEFAKRYLLSSYIASVDMTLDTPDKLIGYFTRLFLGVSCEEFHAIGLDNDLKLICGKLIAVGDTSCVKIPLRNICEFAILHNLTRIVLAHNHPRGESFPSNNDVNSTEDIVRFLMQIDVEVIDHIVIGLGYSFSLRASIKFSRIWA